MDTTQMNDLLAKLNKALDIRILKIDGNNVTIKALDDNAQYLLGLNLAGKAIRTNKVSNNVYTYSF